MNFKYFLIIAALFICNSCNEHNSSSITEKKIIENQPKNYSYGKLYRDLENKFRIQYPSNWELVAGESKHTVVKFINRDSSMSLSVNVMNNDGSMVKEELTEMQLNDYKADLITAMKSVNKEPIEMIVENGFLDNHNAVITSNKYLFKQINVELLFHYYQIQTLKDGKIFNVILSVPEKYFSETFEAFINNFLYSFRFDPS